jgi:hypothetical protein
MLPIPTYSSLLITLKNVAKLYVSICSHCDPTICGMGIVIPQYAPEFVAEMYLPFRDVSIHSYYLECFSHEK